MVDVVVDQCPLGLADSLFDSMQLLREIEAGSSLGEHLDHPVQMPLGAPQPLHDFGVGFMNVIVCHAPTLSPWKGYDKQNWRGSLQRYLVFLEVMSYRELLAIIRKGSPEPL